MTDAHETVSTRNSKWIKVTPEVLYRAFTDAAALPVWLVPGDMTGEVHRFDCRVGGGYQMSLYYPSVVNSANGGSVPLLMIQAHQKLLLKTFPLQKWFPDTHS